MTPTKNGDWTDYNILKNYEISKNLFNNLCPSLKSVDCSKLLKLDLVD